MKGHQNTKTSNRYGGNARVVLKIFFFFLLANYHPLKANAFQVNATQQSRIITGTVKDDAGIPLQGVSVTIKGETAKTQTDANGKYSISLQSTGSHLIFTYIGMETREIPIGSGNVYNVTLLDDSKTLEEVSISTGYMTQKKADLTGAISVISRDDFAKNPSANVMRSLQGKVPGVFITTDGNPAENVGIQVRGITSMNSSPALIVLDGQPVTINLRDINPNDIESMQVLKDAASASIYGSRAAGGVILINTKKGRKGDNTKITVDSYVGASKITGVPDMLNAVQYGQGLWQATVNDGDDPGPGNIRIYNYDWNRDANGVPVLNKVTPIEWLNADHTMPSSDTDWFKEGTRTGYQQNHQLTISSSSERSTSLFSLNYYDNNGTQVTSNFKRYSARFNNDYDLLKGKLTIGENFALSKLAIHDVNSTYGFLVMPPNIPVYDLNGGWGGVAMPLGMDDFNNPVRDLLIRKDNRNNYLKALGTVYANLKILPNLALKTQFGVDYTMEYDRTIDPKWVEAGGKSNTINRVFQNNTHDLGTTWTNTLTYNLKLGEHTVDMLGGLEAYKLLQENFQGNRDGLLLENRDYAYLGTATGDSKGLLGGGNERKLFSYFGKINYAYASKYLLSATIRRDGSSVFGENNKYGFFPAFSAGWRIKNESFLKDVSAISDLKLRASWGQNGNSAPLASALLVNIYGVNVDGTSYPIAGNQTGGIPSGYLRRSLGNQDLKWETTTQTNIGVDFAFLNNRLTGSLDWFNKKTTDMLFLPPYIGALGEGGYKWINGADMTNKGFELILGWNDTKGDFSYHITTNFSAYKNKITGLPSSVRYAYGGNGLLDDVLGRPLNSFYGLVADGIFKTQEEVDNSAQQPGKGIGRIRYKDLDGDGVINEAYDRTWIGVRDPNLMAGLNLQASYKNFDFTAFFQGVFGNDVYNSWKELSDFWNIGVQNDRNHPLRVLDAWTPLNPNSDIPALSRRDSNGEKRLSTYFIEPGSYVKLRSADLGYTFPSKITQKISVERLRLYISAQNLFTVKSGKFTAGDPENPGTGYPMPLTTYLGINVTF
ncbi:SusC/RagA family TonB-linked outer membrane protein [Pedobacter panaciterrae]|uniref:TonB-dependent receptor n=1 Tax=Pedobacter panaciterrae TaxID=363849 RepID=A0ABU8NJC6_9SPHI